jgi:hypothetical protein
MSALGLVIVIGFSASLFIMLAGVKERIGLRVMSTGLVVFVGAIAFTWIIGLPVKEVALMQGPLRPSLGVVFGYIMQLTGVLLMVKEVLFNRRR